MVTTAQTTRARRHTPERRRSADEMALDAFLATCRNCAWVLLERKGCAKVTIDMDCAPLSSLVEAAHSRILSVHASQPCEFQVPTWHIPVAATIAPDGNDMEVRLWRRPPGSGVAIGRSVLTDEFIERILCARGGLRGFLVRQGAHSQRCEHLQARFDYDDLEFKLHHYGEALHLHCCFTARMDA